ncbi:MAG: hypothetical protein M3N53_08695 [Actinomycetota bacterium]|nr:hypothetical protein [Actinomycetota bacterium]
MQLSLSPEKVQVLRADTEDADVEDIIRSPRVEVDVERRSVTVAASDRTEEGSISGELVASARGLKITCGQTHAERRSLHLTFSRPDELDHAVARLEQRGLSVVRSEEDPNYRRGG